MALSENYGAHIDAAIFYFFWLGIGCIEVELEATNYHSWIKINAASALGSWVSGRCTGLDSVDTQCYINLTQQNFHDLWEFRIYVV